MAMGVVWRAMSTAKMKEGGGVVKVIATPTRGTAGGMGGMIVDM